MKTTNWKITYFLCLLLVAVALSVAAAAAANKNKNKNKKNNKYGECDGSMAECGEIAEEFTMESETSKRVLAAATKFISPGALRSDLPTCNGGARGDPYSKSCLPPPSNPQQRGCPKYYGCRG